MRIYAEELDAHDREIKLFGGTVSNDGVMAYHTDANCDERSRKSGIRPLFAINPGAARLISEEYR